MCIYVVKEGENKQRERIRWEEDRDELRLV